MKKMMLVLLLLSSNIFAIERYALVIGNSSYSDSPLQNTINDAIDISDRFQSMGYRVTTLLDGNKEEIDRAVIDLRSRVNNSDMVVFFYAGHGVQINGENYLIPVNELIESEADILYRAVEFSWITNSFNGSGNRTNIYILDACRDNPYASGYRGVSRGLKVVSAPQRSSAMVQNSAVIFATSEGSIASDGDGRNSPFTKALLKYIDLDGETILDVMTYVTQDVFLSTSGLQEPTMTNALKEKVYFGLSEPSSTVIKVVEEDHNTVNLELQNDLEYFKRELMDHYKNSSRRDRESRISSVSGLSAFFSYLTAIGLGVLNYNTYNEEVSDGLLYATGGALMTGVVTHVISHNFGERVEEYDYRESFYKKQIDYVEMELGRF